MGVPLLFAVLLTLSPGAFPTTERSIQEKASESPPKTSPDLAGDHEARLRVRQFLEAWLSRREMKEAFGFFASSAFTNQSMLSEPCVGLFEEGKKSPKQIRKGVQKFLRDGFKLVEGPRGQPLSGILGSVFEGEGDGLAEDLEEQPSLRDSIVNDWRTDRYLILRTEDLPGMLQQPNPGLSESLQRELADRKVLLSFVRFKPGGMVYFIWAIEEGVWKIHHADLICM